MKIENYQFIFAQSQVKTSQLINPKISCCSSNQVTLKNIHFQQVWITSSTYVMNWKFHHKGIFTSSCHLYFEILIVDNTGINYSVNYLQMYLW